MKRVTHDASHFRGSLNRPGARDIRAPTEERRGGIQGATEGYLRKVFTD